MAFSNTTVMSGHGNISLNDNRGAGLPLLMLHGTGASKDVFDVQFQSALANQHRLIAMDFPGHGGSDDAADPEASYSLAGMASVVVDVLDALDIPKVAVLGWSLGGHVAIEMVRSRPDRLSGVLLTGTPPPAHGPVALLRAFQLRPEMLFSSKVHFTPSQAQRFARLCYGDFVTASRIQEIERSDGRSRPLIYRDLTSVTGLSQKAVVERSALPLAVANGANEPIARLSYLESLHYQRLWTGACHVIEGAGHAPFLQRPERFNQLAGRFMAHLAGLEVMEPRTILGATA